MTKRKPQDYELAMVSARSLKLHPENPRVGDIAQIRTSIRENGFAGALVVSIDTKHICAGNHRFLAGKEEGVKEFPVVWRKLDATGERNILLSDNRSSDIAWNNDLELFAALEKQIAGEENIDEALRATLFDQWSFDLLASFVHWPTPDELPELKVAEEADLGSEQGFPLIVRIGVTDPLKAETIVQELHEFCAERAAVVIT